MAQAVPPLRGPAMSAINLTTWIYQDSNTLASGNAVSSRCSYLDKSLSLEALHPALFLWQCFINVVCGGGKLGSGKDQALQGAAGRDSPLKWLRGCLKCCPFCYQRGICQRISLLKSESRVGCATPRDEWGERGTEAACLLKQSRRESCSFVLEKLGFSELEGGQVLLVCDREVTVLCSHMEGTSSLLNLCCISSSGGWFVAMGLLAALNDGSLCSKRRIKAGRKYSCETWRKAQIFHPDTSELFKVDGQEPNCTYGKIWTEKFSINREILVVS